MVINDPSDTILSWGLQLQWVAMAVKSSGCSIFINFFCSFNSPSLNLHPSRVFIGLSQQWTLAHYSYTLLITQSSNLPLCPCNLNVSHFINSTIPWFLPFPPLLSLFLRDRLPLLSLIHILLYHLHSVQHLSNSPQPNPPVCLLSSS